MDDRIVRYMKERDEFARTVASVVAVQLFALAVYFCMYALVAGKAVYSGSERTGRIVVISISAAVAVILCVVNILTVIRSEKVYISRPDSTSIRDMFEAVRLAYSTARPVLILKITYGLIMMTCSGVVYIMLLTLMEDQALAGMYGRIVCCLAVAAAVLIAYPCIDRIGCYRALLGESHYLYYDIKPAKAIRYVLSVVVPASLCLWYILRYYSPKDGVAWMVFPVAALFSLAVSFLIKWSVDMRADV